MLSSSSPSSNLGGDRESRGGGRAARQSARAETTFVIFQTTLNEPNIWRHTLSAADSLATLSEGMVLLFPRHAFDPATATAWVRLSLRLVASSAAHDSQQRQSKFRATCPHHARIPDRCPFCRLAIEIVAKPW